MTDTAAQMTQITDHLDYLRLILANPFTTADERDAVQDRFDALQDQLTQLAANLHYHVAANRGQDAFRVVWTSKAQADEAAARSFGGQVLTYTRYTDKTDECQYCAK